MVDVGSFDRDDAVSEKKLARTRCPKTNRCPTLPLNSEDVSSSAQISSSRNGDNVTFTEVNTSTKEKKGRKPCPRTKKSTEFELSNQELPLSHEPSKKKRKGKPRSGKKSTADETLADDNTTKKKKERKPPAKRKKYTEPVLSDHKHSSSPEPSTILKITNVDD